MLLENYLDLNNLKKESTREGFGKGLVKIAEQNDSVVVLTADLTESTRVSEFQEKFPERFFQVGVAEQNMLGIAAGMSFCGKIPVATSFAVFSPGLNWGQLRLSICFSKANVKIIGCHAGLSVGPDGGTHQALEDIALTRVLPNLVVLSPADSGEAEKAILSAVDYIGPVYIRLSRPETPVFLNDNSVFEIGRSSILREGTDLTLIATGPLVYEALLAAEKVKTQLSIEVINCSSIKPLDGETILSSVRKTGRVVTLEDHQVAGGMGSAVAELLSTKSPVPIRRFGVEDQFGESGSVEELWHKHGLDAESVAERLIEWKK